MDNASDYGSEDCRFDSCLARAFGADFKLGQQLAPDVTVVNFLETEPPPSHILPPPYPPSSRPTHQDFVYSSKVSAFTLPKWATSWCDVTSCLKVLPQ
ncbi:RGD1562890 (predicted) [Rattus norvegicus]|uniref:RGD1562890 (Predicted) n=1 Tax=Rattus norvegicus TaxID=10116 RepID=A6IHB8_RAT|nr:RGD1562890 (predicted) [Rattus norvegicus]